MTRKFEMSLNEKEWKRIQHDHCEQCLWQVVDESRKRIVECLKVKDCWETIIVVKMYDKGIPKNGRGDWPALESAYVYTCVQDDNTWVGLDNALHKLRGTGRGSAIVISVELVDNPAS